MANRVLVDVEDGLSVPDGLCGRAQDFLSRVMEHLGYDGEEVSLFFCGDACIRDLNLRYRNVDAPTDVLSFEGGAEYEDEDGSRWLTAGDIICSMETLPVNASYFSVSENDELKRLLVHGLLHLHGMDHGEEHVEEGKEPVCPMLVLQKRILSAFAADTLIG